MIKNREIGRNLVKFRPDLIKSERAMGYLTGSLGYNGHFFTSLKKTIGVYENIDCVF